MGIPTANSQTPPANDLANAVVTGSFTSATASAAFSAWGSFNALLWGNSGPNGNWHATVQLERSFDGGTTWIVCGVGGGGQQAIYTSAGTGSDVSITVSEPENGVLYRWDCTAFTSGPINYRMSTTSPAPTAFGIFPG